MYLLDTNVISELRKVKSGKANKNVQAWSLEVDSQLLYVSSITIHEIELGILMADRSDEVKGQVLRKWMNEHVLPAFEGRILSVDKQVALVSAGYHVPDPRPYRDTLIAATALVHGMTVITRNTGDFCLDGLKTLNPWDYIG
ncbi:MAG: VapC toxin family PIN domain ribonuclease [Moraxellaceae bacterium]|nr:MAG: VapC toxin family PIN domain ribonuclease [Moraxellaceae bacterium]